SPDDVGSLEHLQMRLARIALLAAGVVVLLATAGAISIVAVPDWAAISALLITAGCVVVALVAGIRATVVLRDARFVPLGNQEETTGERSVTDGVEADVSVVATATPDLSAESNDHAVSGFAPADTSRSYPLSAPTRPAFLTTE